MREKLHHPSYLRVFRSGALAIASMMACSPGDDAKGNTDGDNTGSQSGDVVLGRRSDGSGGSSTGRGGAGAGGGEASAGAAGASQAGSGGSGKGTAGKQGSGGSSSKGGSAGEGNRPVDAGADVLSVPDVREPKPWDSQPVAHFPFPQNRRSSHCTYPTAYRNEDVWAAYLNWKAKTVTADGANGQMRVKRPNEPGLEPDSTVSEGIAYGMIIAVYVNDQSLFDALWKYEQTFLDKCGLMDWYISANGKDRLGTGAAIDADEDMAWALVMADRQWGGKGSLSKSYLDYAKGQIDTIWKCEVQDSKLPRPGDNGDGGGFGGWDHLNISYFAPSYYRVFASVSGNASWGENGGAEQSVVKTVYDTIKNALSTDNGNDANGLVPAWSNSKGAPAATDGAPGSQGNYQYDSCRTPFRVGLDACFFGDTRAVAYVAKTSSFFSAKGASSIVDGYRLNGTESPEYTTKTGKKSAAFIGPAAVGAMSDAQYQPFIDDAYELLATGDMTCGGVYYEESWTVMSLLMLTGNFLDYTQEK